MVSKNIFDYRTCGSSKSKVLSDLVLTEVERMGITQIATIAVMVSDENKAKEWYKKKLNFEVMSNEPHWIVVGPKSSSTGFHLCPDAELEPGNQGIVLRADNIEKTCKELKSNGVEFVRELSPSEWDENIRYAVFKDPDGNEFWLMPE